MSSRKRQGRSDGMGLAEIKVMICWQIGQYAAQNRLSRADLAYGLRIIDCTGKDMRFFEGVATSARVLGISESSVKRARSKLIDIGLLVPEGQSGTGPGRPRRYLVALDRSLLVEHKRRAQDFETEVTQMTSVDPAPEVETGVTQMTRIEEATEVKMDPNRGQNGGQQGSFSTPTEVTQMTPEPLNLRTYEPGDAVPDPSAVPGASLGGAWDAPARADETPVQRARRIAAERTLEAERVVSLERARRGRLGGGDSAA